MRPRLDGFLALTDEDWEWALTINFLAAVRTTRAAIPQLLKRDSSAVITISSVNAFLPNRDDAYSGAPRSLGELLQDHCPRSSAVAAFA